MYELYHSLPKRNGNANNGRISLGESEGDRSGDSQKEDGNKQGVRFFLKDTDEQDVLAKHGETYRCTEAGYILKDGTRLDFYILGHSPKPEEEIDSDEEIRYNRKGLYKQIPKKKYAIISSRIMEDNSRYMARNQELSSTEKREAPTTSMCTKTLLPATSES